MLSASQTKLQREGEQPSVPDSLSHREESTASVKRASETNTTRPRTKRQKLKLTKTSQGEDVPALAKQTLEKCKCPEEKMKRRASAAKTPKKKESKLKKEKLPVRETLFEMNNAKGSIFSDTFAFRAMKKANADATFAMKGSSVQFWSLPDVNLIAQCLYTRLKFNQQKQMYRKQKLISRGHSAASLQGHFIDSNMQILQKEQTAKLRCAAITQCKKLIHRCGNIITLTLRQDQCLLVLQETIKSFSITEDELTR